jgi:hypothetical protein
MRKVLRYMLLDVSKRMQMSLKRIFVLLLFVFLISSSVIVLNTATAEEQQTAKVFADPPAVQSTGIGQNFTVNINVSDVVGLYGWQTGVTFNPNVLMCTGFYQGEFLRRPGGSTIFAQHYLDMNNTLGIVYSRGCTLLGPVAGVNGSGQLAYVTFTSVGVGVSDFHLTDILLLNMTIEDIPFEVVENFTVPVDGTNYGAGIADNLTGVPDPANPPVSGVFNTAFNMRDKSIDFSVLATENWYCQVSVPKALLRCAAPSDWSVRVDGTPIPYDATENATCTVLYFSHNKGDHAVEITGTETTGNNPVPGDLNGDLKVSLADLVILARAYESKPGDPRWNPAADINGDRIVGLSDLEILAQCFGQHN